MVMSRASLRQDRVDRPTSAGVRARLQGAAEQARSFGHADEAITRGRVAGGAPVAIIVDGQAYLFALIGDLDEDPSRVPGMAHRIGDRFARDPVEGRRHGGTDIVEVASWNIMGLASLALVHFRVAYDARTGGAPHRRWGPSCTGRTARVLLDRSASSLPSSRL